ncbi:MAG: hypothetical protein ACUVR2_12080, partial [Anaerolineae bacterium]
MTNLEAWGKLAQCKLEAKGFVWLGGNLHQLWGDCFAALAMTGGKALAMTDGGAMSLRGRYTPEAISSMERGIASL